MKITINIATYPARERYLEQVIRNFLSIGIIDKIRVYLNEYKEVPSFLINDKIEYIIGQANLKDTGKFYWAGDIKDEYYFTCDDDLIYTKIYLEKHLKLLTKYNGNIFVTMHGKILNKNPKTFRDYYKFFHCNGRVLRDEFINFPGTGVMVFDNSKYSIPIEMFKYHGMADLWIALYCQLYEIPCMVRLHNPNKMNELYKGEDTLFRKKEDMAIQHKEILNSIKEWKLFEI
jgi:hypothetical protein